jgi:hypothetical protein
LVANRRTVSVLLLALAGAIAGSAHAADAEKPPSRFDPAKAKAREADRQRLIAKLHAEVPKVQEAPAGTNPLNAPIFHRYDRP